MNRLFKIGIPILIVLLMLVVVGTGIALAKGTDNAASAAATVNAGYSNGNWAGCWNNGGYCPGPCGRGGWYGGNPGDYPPCHGY